MNPLVSPAWLAERLHKAEIAVLDATLPPVGVTPPVDTRAKYREQHIPGAVFFDIDELSDHSTTLPHMMPTAQSFGTRMSKLGVSDTATIVVYEQRGVFSAPRARWMLRSFGAKDVSLLDGGLEAWLAAGLPTKAGDVERPAAVFQAQLDEGCIVDLQTLRSLLSQRTQVLDARSTGRFTGEAPEPRAGLRSGHMPGATSLPFTELVAKGRMKSTDDLAALFASRGIRVNEPVVASCGSGVTAAVLLLGLELLGAPDTRLYDGSWAEYAQQPDAVIVTGSAPEVS